MVRTTCGAVLGIWGMFEEEQVWRSVAWRLKMRGMLALVSTVPTPCSRLHFAFLHCAFVSPVSSVWSRWEILKLLDGAGINWENISNFWVSRITFKSTCIVVLTANCVPCLICAFACLLIASVCLSCVDYVAMIWSDCCGGVGWLIILKSGGAIKQHRKGIR